MYSLSIKSGIKKLLPEMFQLNTRRLICGTGSRQGPFVSLRRTHRLSRDQAEAHGV